MHPFQHVVSGDFALRSLTEALQLEAADLVNMIDDLAIGPLGDVDAESSPERVVFWHQVFGPQATEVEMAQGAFNARMADTAHAFRQLPNDPRPCLVWHGSGATEQLTLFRACHFLRGSSREVWAIEIMPQDQRPLPPRWSTGVGVLNPRELAQIYPRRRPLTGDERTQLGMEWRRAVAEGHTGTLRHPLPDRVETRPISAYDDRILAETTEAWQMTVRVVGNTMGHAEDAMISDAFIFWRVRELARSGVLALDPFEAGMRESRVRRVA